ncbi:glycosyl transferase [Allosaccharopolyspora coralli]|uniref:Glycosyl transferase n=1 Tax=Allosaccharopolyspora coralli TaxID=2665642 RepID=A0A5Q3QBN4_9PSEU|nr:macrolide family glycosyltransferase [Allosaccharopolyspora coralli]QGK68207.1 glycosyl transferase [Allosaccharopolyspora coralli]
MSKRLLFVALAGHGHVTPTIPLVEELVRRGHRVDYATSSEFAEKVTEAGAEWVELPDLDPFRPPADVGPEVIALWFRHFFAALAAVYPVLLEHCQNRRPDLVCYDATHWPGRLVAAKLEIPAVRTVPNLAENEHYGQVSEELAAGLGPDHPEMVAFAKDVATFAADHDVELDVPATFDVTEALNLVFVPRAFQPAGDTFDYRFQFLGPMVGSRAETEPWSPPDSRRPVLYVSLGSIFTDHPEFYRTCVDAFGDGPWQVAMTIGQTDPAALGPVPATVDVRPWFPQPAVLAHAAAFVTHAGMNSTMEALSCGVPLVTLPQMPEQAVNAERIQHLGLGKRLDTDTLTAETLRATVDEVAANPDTAANLERMRRAIADSGGAARGADLIETQA